MKDMECVKKLGRDAVRRAYYPQSRTHFDFPCFESLKNKCKYLDEIRACTFEWPMKEGDF